MIEFPLINKGLVVLINIIGIWLVVLVYRNNPKGKLNKILVWMVVLMFGWVNFAYFARLMGRDQLYLSSLFLKVAWFVTPLLFTLVYFLVIYLLRKEKEYRILNKIIIFLGGTSAIITVFTNLIIKGVKFTNGNLTIIYGSGMLPFLAIVSFLMIATLYPLIKAYFKFPPEEKKKLQYFLVGILIFYLANVVFNIFLPLVLGIVHLYWIGDYSAIFLLGFTVYAIVKQKLFDIKIILTSLLIVLISILLVLDFFIFDIPLFLQILKGVILITFLFLGYSLIKSVLQEIEYRKKLQKQLHHIQKQSSRIQKQSAHIQKQTKNIKALLNMKSELLDTISHQLRTPTSIFRSMLAMITEGDLSKEQKQEFIEDSYTAANRLVMIIDNITEAQELEGEDIGLNLNACRIKNIIQEVMHFFSRIAKEKNISLEFIKPEAKLPPVVIDDEKIKSAINKLIDNALWYTQENGKVIVKCQITNDKLQIKVKDTGIGLTKDDKKILFTQFGKGRGAKTMNVNSSELGLYIAKEIIKAHKGTIKAESKGKNKGSVFTITLPVMQEV